jgi:hypothetical protein
MIKSDLIQRVAAQNPHLYQRDVEKIVSTIFDEIVEALRRGDRVELRGFGAFSTKLRGHLPPRPAVIRTQAVAGGRVHGFPCVQFATFNAALEGACGNASGASQQINRFRLGAKPWPLRLPASRNNYRSDAIAA